MKLSIKNLILFSIIILFGCQNTKTEEKKNENIPNIIIIHVDDLGFADLGCFGSDFYDTPYIDKLANEGMKFTNSYAAAAVCSPTRAALLTGKYPSRLGVTDWIRAKFQGGIIGEDGLNPVGYEENNGLPLKTPKNSLFLGMDEKIIPQYLTKWGFKSAHFGKWHLGQEDHFPELRGFDLNFGGCDLGQPPSYFDPYLPPDNNPDYIIPNIQARSKGEYLTDREGYEIEKFIIDNKSERFFVHWAPYAVHTPIQAKDSLIQKYKSKESGRQNNPTYAAMVESLDQNIGMVLRTLDSLNLSKNTIIIFTSDNGGLIGNPNNPITNNFPLRSGKGYPYEGGIRVPTIIKWPDRIKSGSVSDSPIMSIDVLPTLLDALGETNELSKGYFDGISLLEIFKHPETNKERDLFWHFPHYRGSDVVPYSIVRSNRYKLIKYYDGKESELYDVISDISEMNNISLENPSKVNELEIKINEWVRMTNTSIPILKE
jgi:arylsulfatase A